MSKRLRFLPVIPYALALLWCACDPGDDDTVDDDDAADDDDTFVAEGCRGQPQAADRDRQVIVARPYDDSGGQSPAWSALTLTADGELLDDDLTFEMGRALMGEVVFTPDGQVGLVAQEDGTIGVFTLTSDGLTVIHAAFAGDFYASRIVVDPSGEMATIVDGNWVDNGGGLYRVPIDCDDGSLGTPALLRPAKLAADLLLPHGVLDRAVLVAKETDGAPAGDDVHLLSWDDGSWLSGAAAFGDEEAIVSDAALSHDGRYVLFGDYSAFSGIPNRVAVAQVDGDSLTAVQVIEDVEDPVALVASPYEDGVLVVSGYGDALFFLPRGDGGQPYSHGGEVDYHGASPQLPGAASLLTRGSQRGLVAVSENQGVRLVRFNGDGDVEDLGLAVSGSGMDAIGGAIGIQP